MANAMLLVLLYPLLLFAALLLSCHGLERKIYIVYMGEKPQGDFSVASTHHSMLERVFGSTLSAKESLIYSYGRSFNGFAAKLTDEEVTKFSEMEGVISVLQNHKLKLHTTRSWDFMGLTRGKLGSPQEGDVIIGLIDSGIWPESDSFNDEGLSSPPSKWTGVCQVPTSPATIRLSEPVTTTVTTSMTLMTSNPQGTPTVMEPILHQQLQGGRLAGASYFGLAEGTARGGVPSARIAMNKVCRSFGCSTADLLAAFDDAIADGVDIISLSIGLDQSLPYIEDTIAIGSFHAMKNDILTSCSAAAGNLGPEPLTVSNYAPWILTVAASTIDRKFVAQAVLGNGQVYTGLSINRFNLNGTSFPLIWGGDAANYSAGANSEISKNCLNGTMNSYKVRGKIVFCETIWDGTGIILANGVGTIMAVADSSIIDFADNFPLPATLISREDGLKVLDYIRSTENPIATILVSEAWKDVMAPYVISFSSRGPNPFTPDILKPDLTAPGVDILAAWAPVAHRSAKFHIISGTSMSCPHASGAAAYVKAAHPNWSPAAIKSAHMTTAYIMDSKKNRDLEFAYGSGHINRLQAVDPGLVYDATEADYIDFLCNQGYNTTTLRLITGDNSSFCNTLKPGRAWNLNYPSFSLAVEDGQHIMAVFTRTVTNVGSPNSTYTLSMYMPTSIAVTVEPSVLSFSALGEKKSFTVQVYGPNITQQPIPSGTIMWNDGVHVVRSPLVVYTILPGSLYSSFTMSQKKLDFKGSSMYHKNGILGHKY